uniref:DUF4286 family protein n=1 Tax=Natronospira sp. TaxID=2024970 RepID=UPI0038731EC1
MREEWGELESKGGELIYEVNLEISPRQKAAFDDWLSGHVQALLEQPGFLSARILRNDEQAEDRWARRTVSYRLRDRQALDDYIAGPAEAMRADGLCRFGGSMRASRRTLRLVAEISALGNCENCPGV